MYEVSRTMLDCDVFISVPKSKTHKKVGVTLNAKGLVGITTNKNLCVHYTLGSPSQGGDQFPDGLFTPMELRLIALERWMYDHLLASGNALLERLHRAAYWLHGRLLKPLGIVVDPSKRLLDAGNWYGNDSAWRMVADLLQIIHYADRDGRMHSEPQRRFFSVVDGIIGGENNGPLSPDPKPAGILLGGESLLAVDLVATRVMGFDPMKLKQFSILQDSRLDFGFRSLRELDVSWSKGDAHGCLDESATPLLAFRPHPGWEGHIEVGGGSCG